jgi:hypothetical protein
LRFLGHEEAPRDASERGEHAGIADPLLDETPDERRL